MFLKYREKTFLEVTRPLEKITKLVFVLIFLWGCVAGEGGKKTATCTNGQSFDSVSRKCSGAQVLDEAPVGTTRELSLIEGADRTTVELRYTDSQNDFATSCNAYTNAPGLIRDLDYQGVRIRSREDNQSPEKISVIFREEGSSSNVTTFPLGSGFVTILIKIPASGVDSNTLASQIDASAGSYVNAVALELTNVFADGKTYSLSELDCGCFGGTCTTSIKPADFYNGTTEFYYTITDEDGTSTPRQVLVNVSSLNDPPEVIPSFVLYDPGFASRPTELFNDYSNSGSVITSINVASSFTVTDVEGDPTSFVCTRAPTYDVTGKCNLSSSGVLTYRTTSHIINDSIRFVVVDSLGGQSDEIEFQFVVNPVFDPPVGTTSTATSIFEEGSISAVELEYSDEESDTISSCLITGVSKMWPIGPCTCSGTPAVCEANFRTIPDQNGTGTFSYIIFDTNTELTQGNPGYPVSKTVSVPIVAQNDAPIIYPTANGNQTIEFAESDTFDAADATGAPYTFTLDGGIDKDGDTIFWELDTEPTGTLSGCLPAVGNTIPTCTYVPSNGNLANSSASISPIIVDDVVNTAYSRTTVDSGVFYASTLGDGMDGFEIELVDVGSTTLLIGAAAYTDGQKVTIFYEDGVTLGSDIEAAVNANSEVRKLIQFDAFNAATNETQTGTHTLAGGVPLADSFVIKATDGNGAVSTQKISISILPVDDAPTLCEYSTYDETTVCGLNGCISDGVPDDIVADKEDLAFYSLDTGSCYKSNANGTWSPVRSFVKDRSINELDPIVIDNIRVDEGGGASEDDEGIRIIDINSSDTNLVPLGNIEIYYGDPLVRIGDGDDIPLTIDGTGLSADLEQLRIVITPQTINPPVDQKTATIEFEIADFDPATPGPNIKTTEVVFDVNVLKVSATHGGWANFKATGPKVDSLGLVNEDRLVCPYSLDMCEGGQQCFGTSTPINNSSADPDTADAIFMQETSGNVTCYRMKRKQVQNIAYVGKTSDAYTIQYLDTNTSGQASVSVDTSSNLITISIDDDVTTTDTIIAAIEDNSSPAKDLIKAINLKVGETQNTQGAETIPALSNANWESFETYCSATPVALEPGCDVGGRKSCVGTTTPVGNITPTKLDSRYWDEKANVCYRSTGTTANDWETYDAPAEVEISWNQFNVNGSGAVSEYRVFRRIAGEEFDFSKPINRQTISGSQTTFTFTDNHKNSVVPPSPGTVYYYVVRPVVNDILTSTAAETGTNAIGVVRIMAPPKNMAFAHRWMINKNVCAIMNKASDSTNNYRCAYKGPGDMLASDGNYYYDYQKDILVDRFEAGCPYSSAPNCPFTFDNSCIGVSAPTGAPPANNLIYYARSEGQCYMSSGGAWQAFDAITLANYFSNIEPNSGNLDSSNPQFDSRNDKLYHRSSLPPLTNITQERANDFCRSLEDIPNSELVGIDQPLEHKLPGRKDQIAYSLWDGNEYTDSEIAVKETGLSLNSSSKCNSSQASGLEDGYVNIDKPDSNDFYSLPGTDASGIRSITTGSNETASCTSAFGVQDTTGNVAEWTSNRLNCSGLSQCFGNSNLVIQNVEIIKLSQTNDVQIGIINDAAAAAISDTSSGGVRSITVNLDDFPTAADVASAIDARPNMNARVISGDGSELIFPVGGFLRMGTDLTGADDTSYGSTFATLPSNTNFDDYGLWSMDGRRGPCVDANSDDICDASISSWAIEDERFSAGRFFIPMGLPAEVSSNSTFDTDYSLAEIGPTSGITSLQLHDDTITIDSQNIFASAADLGCGGFAAGGSYLAGNGAGVWSLEALPCSDTFGALTIQDISFRALNDTQRTMTVRFVETDAGITNVGYNSATNALIVDLADVELNFGSRNAASVVAAINVADGGLPFDIPGTSSDLLWAYISGNPASIQAAFTTPVEFTDTRTTATPKRVDVGFRCMIEIDPGNSIPGSGTNGDYDE